MERNLEKVKMSTTKGRHVLTFLSANAGCQVVLGGDYTVDFNNPVVNVSISTNAPINDTLDLIGADYADGVIEADLAWADAHAGCITGIAFERRFYLIAWDY